MTDKRKNNGGQRDGAGRKRLGADKMLQFSVMLTPEQAVWFKNNGVNALRELIQETIKNET
jgi:hypothetical protein